MLDDRITGQRATVSEFPRKSIRLGPDRYRGKRYYFVTLCFDNRRRFGANKRVAPWLVERLQHHAIQQNFAIQAYCVMPDHMHVLTQGTQDGSDLFKFINAFKQDTGFHFKARTKRKLWQTKYFDHILRTEDTVVQVSWYIWTNPVRKGLCERAQDFEFSGSFTVDGKEQLQSEAKSQWTPPWEKPSSEPTIS